MGTLDSIHSPADIKGFSPDQRRALAQEIRERIIATVAKTGGHLATNLGTVELSLAVHTAFNAPSDAIVWDTGHNAYTHKLLTGRVGRFHTLRQHGGLSGFLKRDESPYDCFGAGHAATSVSAAAGMALARDMRHGGEKVVCIIGDSSIPNGMAFEALNHLGHSRPDFLLILNDNEMSISPPVGAVSKYLSRVITNRHYNRARKEAEALLKKLPMGLGEHAAKFARHAEEMAKSLVSPGILFEELGFLYIGPVDGHDTEGLIEVLNEAKNMKGPVLLHVVTKKGKGFAAAESDPTRFHGLASFDPETGASIKAAGGKSWSQAFAERLHEAAAADKAIAVITPAMTAGSCLDSLAADFPERFFDVGIAEEHAVTLAAGMAAHGAKPVVCIYSTFMQRAFDQAIHDVALQRLPVIFALDRAGLVGDDGPTHHGVLDIALFRLMPGMVVMAPSDENEMARMLATARGLPGPSVIRLPRGAVPGVPADRPEAPLALGRSALRREGADVALLALGRSVREALQAAEILAAEGIQARVVDMRFAKPLDREAVLAAAAECRAIITLEEGTMVGGFGSAVLEALAEAGTKPGAVSLLGVPDRFIEHGSPGLLLAECRLDPAGIAAEARKLARATAPAQA